MKKPVLGYNRIQSFIDFETTAGKLRWGMEEPNQRMFAETPVGKVYLTDVNGYNCFDVINDISGLGVLINGVKLLSGNISSTSSVTGVGLYINKTANTAGTLKIHCHQMAASTDDSPNQYANEFKGEFLATSGTMDGIASHFHMSESGTGVLRSVIGVAYFDAAKTLSGANPTGSFISGGLFSCQLAGTAILNGTAVIAAGAWCEIQNAINTTMTAVNHVAGLVVAGKLLVNPSSGQCSLVYLSQQAGATVINQAIYLEGANLTGAFVTFDVAGSGKAIEALAKKLDNTNTTHALHIKIGSADGYIPVFAAKWNT